MEARLVPRTEDVGVGEVPELCRGLEAEVPLDEERGAEGRAADGASLVEGRAHRHVALSQHPIGAEDQIDAGVQRLLELDVSAVLDEERLAFADEVAELDGVLVE